MKTPKHFKSLCLLLGVWITITLIQNISIAPKSNTLQAPPKTIESLFTQLHNSPDTISLTPHSISPTQSIITIILQTNHIPNTMQLLEETLSQSPLQLKTLSIDSTKQTLHVQLQNPL